MTTSRSGSASTGALFITDDLAHERRSVEAELNAFPQYQATITEDGVKYKVHFLALFSERKDATPILFSHGWPGSILEFVPMLQLLQKTYTPATLPHHIIVPSLIGYGFSSPPPTDRPFTGAVQAAIFDGLMRGLGFGKEHGGYLAQGGDVGSFVVRIMTKFDGCNGKSIQSSSTSGALVFTRNLQALRSG